MEFVYDKTICKNLRRSLRREWLETNGLGSYASSTIACCNTRKYHGLLVTQLADPPGRYVLLSTLEESLSIGGKEAELSCRKHPDVYHPSGHEFLHQAKIGNIPAFVYRYGDTYLTRQIMMLENEDITLIRYTLSCALDDENSGSIDTCTPLPGPALLRIKPLLAYRNMHALSQSTIDLQVKTWPAKQGFSVQPYNSLPPLFMQTNKKFIFHPSPDWYYNVEYMIEAARGFGNHEDLFQPGVIDFELEMGQSVILSASTDDVVSRLGSLDKLWKAEEKRREKAIKEQLKFAKKSELLAHLQREGQRFIVGKDADSKSIVAGYHWFEAWGRDTCIALAGLTFYSGKDEEGFNVLNRLAKEAVDGQIPNMFSADGNHSYNCIDASLWFVWACQAAYSASPENAKLLRKHCWPFIKDMIANYASNKVPYVHCDEEGFLHVGTPDTQLTWMDASVNGKAVTPRFGCPVEINALWYNALAFANELAKEYGQKNPHSLCLKRSLEKMKINFKEHFWIENTDYAYLADCWRPYGSDASLRPNQLFAVGLPHAILDEEYAVDIVETCRKFLLTPFGMRTLSPDDARYHSLYKGSPEERDGAYHQGTVWPWPLGIYADSLIKTAEDKENAARELLETLTPLLTKHMRKSGVGTISEIFTADPPYLPDGCIAQAWSIAEIIRLLTLIRKTAPKVLSDWEEEHIQKIVIFND